MDELPALDWRNISAPGDGPGVLRPWQREALAEGLGGARGLAWAGGKGSGKSVAACVLAAMLCRTRPGARVVLGMDTHTRLVEVHQPILAQVCPGLGATWRAGDSQWRFQNGSNLTLRHLDMSGDPQMGGSPVEGMNLAGIVADELQQVDARYLRVFLERTRVSVCGLPPVVALSGLPLGTWWMAEAEERGWKTWRPRTRDNAANLAETYESDLRASMTEREAAAWLDGEELVHEGQVLSEFSARPYPDGSLVEKWTPDWSTTRTLLGMDLGGRDPHALLLAEHVQLGAWVVVREWYATGGHVTIGDFCRRVGRDCIRRLDWRPGDRRVPLDAVVSDPAGAAVNAQTRHSDLDLIAQGQPDGLGIRPTVETIPERRMIPPSVHRLKLAIEQRRLLVTGEVWREGMKERTGRSLAKSILGYRWDPKDPERPLKDDVHDHAIDALRYAMRCPLTGLWEPTRVRTAGVESARQEQPSELLREARDAR